MALTYTCFLCEYDYEITEDHYERGLPSDEPHRNLCDQCEHIEAMLGDPRVLQRARTLLVGCRRARQSVAHVCSGAGADPEGCTACLLERTLADLPDPSPAH